MPATRLTEHKLFKPAAGAALAALCGLVLWRVPAFVDASYDNLFRFSASRCAYTNLVLILMDNAAYSELGQHRGEPWKRDYHRQLLEKLEGAGRPVVAFDIFFRDLGDAAEDKALADAIQRYGPVVLMTELGSAREGRLASASVQSPCSPFDKTARHFGIGFTEADKLQIARRHWPFPAPDPSYTSLSWSAAQLAGAQLPVEPQRQWLRYYGGNGGWQTISYHDALNPGSNPPVDFTNKVVFIGNEPANNDPALDEVDKFRSPCALSQQRAIGGVQILATQFLNLMNGDWLRRPAAWLEVLVLIGTGAILGGGLSYVRSRLLLVALALGAACAVLVGAVSLSYYTNYWFPWLAVAGGELPCALAYTLLTPALFKKPYEQPTVILAPPARAPADALVTPGYTRLEPPIGEGAFGKVWMAKTVTGELKALKVIYRAECERNDVPYEVEFNAISKYMPISSEHPGLLHIGHVDRNEAGSYYYYVMELGDALVDDWDRTPATYQPRDLARLLERRQAPLPIADCFRVGLALTEALAFLHGKDLVHRDIKPRNIIYVKGRPKLADVGLVTDLRKTAQIKTFCGTLDYLPPLPERPGTCSADIYSLGKVLYVLSTGRHPLEDFPALPAEFVEKPAPGFQAWNQVVMKACAQEPFGRYASAADMHKALKVLSGKFSV